MRSGGAPAVAPEGRHLCAWLPAFGPRPGHGHRVADAIRLRKPIRSRDALSVATGVLQSQQSAHFSALDCTAAWHSNSVTMPRAWAKCREPGTQVPYFWSCRRRPARSRRLHQGCEMASSFSCTTLGTALCATCACGRPSSGPHGGAAIPRQYGDVSAT